MKHPRWIRKEDVAKKKIIVAQEQEPNRDRSVFPNQIWIDIVKKRRRPAGSDHFANNEVHGDDKNEDRNDSPKRRTAGRREESTQLTQAEEKQMAEEFEDIMTYKNWGCREAVLRL